MAKVKTAYVCTECGADYSKWQGQCTACHEWNTVSEVRGVSGPGKGARSARFEGYAGSLSAVKSLDEVSLAEQARISTRSEEHTSELQSRPHLVCRLLLEKKKKKTPR